MKKKNLTRLAVIFLAGTLLVGYGVISASAQESNVTYEGGSKQVVTFPSDDLFQSFKTVMPGDTVAQSIKIQNNKGEKVTIQLKAEDASGDSKSQDLLNQLQLELKIKETSKLIYSGPLSGKTSDKENGTKSMTDYISLGTYDKNTQAELIATLQVPGTIGNQYQNYEAKINWIFRAEGTDVISTVVSIPDESVPLHPPTSSVLSASDNESGRVIVPIDDDDVPMNGLPSTGDRNNWIWIAVIAAVSAGAVIVVLKSKKTDNKN